MKNSIYSEIVKPRREIEPELQFYDIEVFVLKFNLHNAEADQTQVKVIHKDKKCIINIVINSRRQMYCVIAL